MTDDKKGPDPEGAESKGGAVRLGRNARKLSDLAPEELEAVETLSKTFRDLKNQPIFRDLEKATKALTANHGSIIPDMRPSETMFRTLTPEFIKDDTPQRQMNQLVTLTQAVVDSSEQSRKYSIAVLVVAGLTLIVSAAALAWSIFGGPDPVVPIGATPPAVMESVLPEDLDAPAAEMSEEGVDQRDKAEDAEEVRGDPE
jgi:hypothetical protein